jgi:uncharacterized protein
MKKIIIAGGTGFLGTCLIDHYSTTDNQLVVLTRGKSTTRGRVSYVNWNGKTLGAWKDELNGADVLINLNGKSVDCRYTDINKSLIYSTRLDATTVLGQAVEQCALPPTLWINASSATIYRHALDKEMDERTGEYGKGFSVDVCQKWEATFNRIEAPQTRKVIIRTAIVLGKKAGAMKPLKMLARVGVGGAQGPGNQYVSWLHEQDFVEIIDFIIAHADLEGTYNLAAPTPITNDRFMKSMRKAVGIPFGIPMPAWLLKVGAVLIGTESELILKSRRVEPRKLLEAGYRFRFTQIEPALADLCNNDYQNRSKTA